MLITKIKYIFFSTTFVLCIANFNANENSKTYLKYSPSEDALFSAGNSVIRIGDTPSSIGLILHKMGSLNLKISSHNLYEKLLKEFHPTLNGVLKLNDFTRGSNKKVWWKCDVAEDHEWESKIIKRVNGSVCPCCCGQKVVVSNCLATTHPEISKQWHPTKNNGVTPFDVTFGSDKFVWWKCDKGEDHEWSTAIKKRARGDGCTCCSGRKTVLSNCLYTNYPNDAKQWHPTKNLPLTPFDIGRGQKKIWWKCDKADDHEWESSINNKIRNSANMGCPFCVGRKVALSNCLLTIHPDIAKQWHPTKNFPLTATDVSFGSGKKVWWKCSNSHEWFARIDSLVTNNHNGRKGCPLCFYSNGERMVKIILDRLNISYVSQKKFDNCKNRKNLRFDLYIPKYNVLIEYDGHQHFKPIDFFGGIDAFNENKKRDEIKNKFATKNKIHLLRIPYTKFHSIEYEIKSFFKSKKIEIKWELFDVLTT